MAAALKPSLDILAVATSYWRRIPFTGHFCVLFLWEPGGRGSVRVVDSLDFGFVCDAWRPPYGTTGLPWQTDESIFDIRYIDTIICSLMLSIFSTNTFLRQNQTGDCEGNMPTVNGHVVLSLTIAVLIMLWLVHAMLRKSENHRAGVTFLIMMAGIPLASVALFFWGASFPSEYDGVASLSGDGFLVMVAAAVGLFSVLVSAALELMLKPNLSRKYQERA